MNFVMLYFEILLKSFLVISKILYIHVGKKFFHDFSFGRKCVIFITPWFKCYSQCCHTQLMPAYYDCLGILQLYKCLLCLLLLSQTSFHFVLIRNFQVNHRFISVLLQI